MAENTKTLTFKADRGAGKMLYDKTVVIKKIDDRCADIRITSASRFNPGWVGTFSTPAMQELRDTLIEMYPLPPQPEVEMPTSEELTAPAKKPNWKGKQAYKGNGKHGWEKVNDVTTPTSAEFTERLRVPGGWLYRLITVTVSGVTPTMVFVPMPNLPGSYPI